MSNDLGEVCVCQTAQSIYLTTFHLGTFFGNRRIHRHNQLPHLSVSPSPLDAS